MQSLVQELPQRVFGIFEEQTVVAKRRHSNGDLSQVVEILQHRTLQRNHQTQVTGGRGEGGKGGSGTEASSVEARGPWAESVQVPNQAQVPQSHGAHPPCLPCHLLHLIPSHMPISPWDCPPVQRWRCSLFPPKWGPAQGRRGSYTAQLTPTCILSSPPLGADPTGQSRRCPTWLFGCCDCKRSGGGCKHSGPSGVGRGRPDWARSAFGCSTRPARNCARQLDLPGARAGRADTVPAGVIQMTEKTQCRVHGSVIYIREKLGLSPTTRDWSNQLQTIQVASHPPISLQNEEHRYYVAVAQKNAHIQS